MGGPCRAFKDHMHRGDDVLYADLERGGKGRLPVFEEAGHGRRLRLESTLEVVVLG